MANNDDRKKPEQVNTIRLIYLNHFGMPALVQPKGGVRDGQEGKQEGKQERQGAKRSKKIAPDR